MRGNTYPPREDSGALTYLTGALTYLTRRESIHPCANKGGLRTSVLDFPHDNNRGLASRTWLPKMAKKYRGLCSETRGLRARRFRFFGARSRASADDGVERVTEDAAGTSVEALDVFSVSCLAKVLLDKARVALVVQPVPEGNCLGRKAAVSMLPHPTTRASYRSRCRCLTGRTTGQRWN